MRPKSLMLGVMGLSLLGVAEAAERCAWTKNEYALHLTLDVLQDADAAPRRRLWSLERQPTLLGLKPVRIAQTRTVGGTLEWVLEQYPGGRPAAVQLQGVRWVDHAEHSPDCPAERRAALQFERSRVPAASCPDAQAAATVLSGRVDDDNGHLGERMRGTPSTTPDDLNLVLDGHDYVLRHHREGGRVERRFGSATDELADAADDVIEAVLSCAEDARAETVSVRL